MRWHPEAEAEAEAEAEEAVAAPAGVVPTGAKARLAAMAAKPAVMVLGMGPPRVCW